MKGGVGERVPRAYRNLEDARRKSALTNPDYVVIYGAPVKRGTPLPRDGLRPQLSSEDRGRAQAEISGELSGAGQSLASLLYHSRGAPARVSPRPHNPLELHIVLRVWVLEPKSQTRETNQQI